MRVLVLIASDIYVRNLLDAGAFEPLEADPRHEVAFVAAARGVTQLERLAGKPGWLGTVPDPPERERGYGRLELLTRVSLRSRSTTLRAKTAQLPPRTRRRLRLLALPGVRRIARAALLARLGRNPHLDALFADCRPDLLLAPSGGNDALVNDAVRSARRAGICSLLVVHNWDGLTSKGALTVPPDHLAVWGPQAVEHAQRLHRLPTSRVHVVGSAALDLYFNPPRAQAAKDIVPRFEDGYVLFAGCYAPFDERTVLESLDATIERLGLGLRVVYRPHPHRFPRARPDRIDESRLRHVVLDPEVRDLYERSFAPEGAAERRQVRYPPLEGYPALFAGALIVISPLSTVMLEAIASRRRVLALAFGDDSNVSGPDVVASYDHLQGLERLGSLDFIRSPEELEPGLVSALERSRRDGRTATDDLGFWVHTDDRPFGARLKAVVEAIDPGAASPDDARRGR